MSRRLRRTKIVTTLGPATDRDNNLEKIISAGANVVRLNFSHGTAEDHLARANKVREIAAKLGRHVAILGDLQGPKIRVSTFKEGKVFLNIGDKFLLDADLTTGEGDKEKVGIDYKRLPEDVVPGDILLLDDGRVQLKVLEVKGSKVFTEVTVGGPLSNNKGINKLGGGLSAEALTEKTSLISLLRRKFLSIIWQFLSLAPAKTLTTRAALHAMLVVMPRSWLKLNVPKRYAVKKRWMTSS